MSKRAPWDARATASGDVSEEAIPVAKSDDWDRHWQAYEELNARSPAQAYRRRLVLERLALERARGPVRLIDLGCGSGILASAVLRVRPDAEVVGVDLSESGVRMASHRVLGARFFQRDFSKALDLEGTYRGWATHAVCSEVLEHLDDPAAVLRRLRAQLAPGCRLVVTVPAGPMSAFDRHIGHRKHFDAAGLARTLHDAGLTAVEVRAAGFPFFNLYRLAVVARGEKLVSDTAPGTAGLGLAGEVSLRAFAWLFKLNTSRTRLGWQLVAMAAEPG
jgi:2-polyprenyl-3-methyl-5-hydroxy-6-metoxy-1,4-benzoquinol methylase